MTSTSKEKRRVSVFGNILADTDSICLRMLPILKKRFPKVEFNVEDPTETLIPTSEEWWIIDAAEGVEQVCVLEDLSKIKHTKSSSVHDYDLSLDLLLLEKLGKLPKVKIIIVPYSFTERQAVHGVSTILSSNGF